MNKYLLLLIVLMSSCATVSPKPPVKEPAVRIICQTPSGQPMLDTVVSSAQESQGALRIRLNQEGKVVEAIVIGATCMTTEIK